jgi:alkylation response protein AidB-like acyl-CoA dehydrogenase
MIAAADLTRSVARLTPKGRSPIAPVGGELSELDVQACISLGRALVCADLVGVMRGVIALTTAYASFRRQFEVPVGSFQAVQHLIADACVAMEGSRSVALHAAWAVDALPAGDALFATSVAKAYCARAARGVCETGIQVHGGIGNTWDCPVHVFLRRALLSIDLFGGVGASLDRVLAHQGIGGRDGLR